MQELYWGGREGREVRGVHRAPKLHSLSDNDLSGCFNATITTQLDLAWLWKRVKQNKNEGYKWLRVGRPNLLDQELTAQN